MSTTGERVRSIKMTNGEWLNNMAEENSRYHGSDNGDVVLAYRQGKYEGFIEGARALAKELREWIQAEGEVHSEEVKQKLTELVGEE